MIQGMLRSRSVMKILTTTKIWLHLGFILVGEYVLVFFVPVL
jgi:hypothetical protein